MASKHNLRQKDVADAIKENYTHLLNRVVTYYQVELGAVTSGFCSWHASS